MHVMLTSKLVGLLQAPRRGCWTCLQLVRNYDSGKALSRPELVIDGRTLSFVLGDKPCLSHCDTHHAFGVMPCCIICSDCYLFSTDTLLILCSMLPGRQRVHATPLAVSSHTWVLLI